MSGNSDSTYNRFDHEFSQPGISPDMYQFKEEEETFEKLENDNIEDVDDNFRHKPIQIDDIHKFRHKIDIQNINKKDGFTYFKSDYCYASKIDEINVKIDEIENNKTEEKYPEKYKIDFEGKKIFKLIHKPYFRLFGFELLTPINDYDNDSEKFFSFLNYISLNRNGQLDDNEAKEEWKIYNENIKYDSKILLKDCKSGGDNESIIKWVLAFHNFGIMNHIYFTFTIFYEDAGEIKFSKFSVGKKYHRNRCFVTFLSNGKKEKKFIPHVLSLITITKKEKMKEKDATLFSPISNLFWILTNIKEKETNIIYDFMTYKTLYYNIYVQENNKFPINYKKSKNNSDENKPHIALTSVSKLNCFLRKVEKFKMATQSDLLINYYPNATNKIDKSDKKILNFEIDSSQTGIAHVRDVEEEKYYKEEINEYKIFVGLRGISYEKSDDNEFPQVSSHISILTYMKLISLYVDENMDKMYCLFNEANEKVSRLVEGDFGTTKADDMKTVLFFNFIITEADFKVDIYNHLHLQFKANENKITCSRSTDGSWKVTKEELGKSLIIKIEDNNEDTKIKNSQRYTLPIALEISNKLFVMSDKSSLYHPSWRNCILRQSIISTFYRFAYHMASDSLVFELNNTEDENGDESEVVSAIIYPHIDIGFRGNTRRIFTSTISPGIYEYSDRAFNYEPLKDLLPNTKTDCLFFNNGKLKVGLDRHRTKCQIAATALFGYACSIYGPGMTIRDFKIGEGNPYSRKSFQLIHNFLVAAYGTFLKMENDVELEYAIDVISEELNIEANKHVYKNLMDELRKDYY